MKELIIGLGCLLMVSACSQAEDVAQPSEQFRQEVKAHYEAANEAGRLTVEGKDGWLYTANELRFLSVGPFWGEAAAEVSRASKPDFADPIPGIVGFHEGLKAKGIELIVLPVPPKAAVYPEHLTSLPGGVRYDDPVQQFYQELRSQGVQVLDLTGPFMEMSDSLAYCQTDTHWSPAACGVAASVIYDLVKDRPWVSELEKQSFVSEDMEKEISGDLVEELGESRTETLAMKKVFREEGGERKPVVGDATSPIILMGDSHTLVFQDGSLLAANAGLADQLALQFGIEPDLEFRNRGSGSSLVRKNLFRKQLSAARAGEDYLGGKKLVIWCFTAREFTETTDGWQAIPVERK